MYVFYTCLLYGRCISMSFLCYLNGCRSITGEAELAIQLGSVTVSCRPLAWRMSRRSAEGSGSAACEKMKPLKGRGCLYKQMYTQGKFFRETSPLPPTIHASNWISGSCFIVYVKWNVALSVAVTVTVFGTRFFDVLRDCTGDHRCHRVILVACRL